jgi:hypothetical protein
MTSPLTTVVASSVADLKTKWTELIDVDRALAVHKIHVAGMSFGKLAKELGRSSTLLRNLDQAAQAPAEDIGLARKRQISTRQLVLRSKAADQRRAAQEKEALNQKRTKAAQQAAVRICEWLDENISYHSQAESIVEEARRILAQAEFFEKLPKCPPPSSKMPVAEIIVRMRPPASVNPDVESAGWFAAWLARWAFYAFRDSVVRDKALNIALDYQIREIRVSKKRRE